MLVIGVMWVWIGECGKRRREGGEMGLGEWGKGGLKGLEWGVMKGMGDGDG
jgi:hypothetical protein